MDEPKIDIWLTIGKWVFRGFLVLLVAGIALAACAVNAGKVAPDATADAIVVHPRSGQVGLDHADELALRGTSDTIVLLGGGTDKWPESSIECGRTYPALVVCVPFDQDNTLGQVKALNPAATEQSWDSLVVVSTDYHVRRAAATHRRCGYQSVEPSGVEDSIPIREFLKLATIEVVAFPQSFFALCGE